MLQEKLHKHMKGEPTEEYPDKMELQRKQGESGSFYPI